MQLDPEAAAAGVRLVTYDRLGSTNAEALALARAGETGPLWVVARSQSAGRGRRGNVWASEPGNLYASLLVVDPGPPDRAAELSFAAGLAVYDAIRSLAPPLRARLALKWPNDVLIDGKKVAGILIEGETAFGRPLAVTVGIGVNCAHHPPTTHIPATDLAGCGVAATPEAMLEHLSRAMLRRLGRWERGEGFAAIRADWLAHAAGLGETIHVRLPDRELDGRFETLDRAGRLMLRLESGALEAITVGEVFASVRPVTDWQPSGGRH